MPSRPRVHKLPVKRTEKIKVQRAILLLVVLVVIFSWMSAPTLKLIREKSLNKKLKRQLSTVQANNTILKKDLKKLKTKSYIELKARNDLGLVKQDEIQYYVLTKNIKTAAKPKIKPKKWYEKTLDFIEMIFVK